VVTRAHLDRGTAEALIESGTLRAFGKERRELLWELGLLIPVERATERERDAETGRQTRKHRTKGHQAGLALPVEPDMAALPSLTHWEALAWDYARTGVTGGKHPIALLRPHLHEGMVTSLHIGGIRNPRRLPQGMRVEIAGMVVTRQRPSTASGVMFMLLEDEFGLVNIVVWTAIQERFREVVRTVPFVIIRGTIDNEKSGLPNIIAEEFERCPLPLILEAPGSHDFG
jgi:error-prone DNA polymerase